MSLKKDLQESLKDPRPLYAVVGATDLVVEKLRDAGSKAAHDAPHLKDIEDKAVSDATKVVRGVRRVPSIALNQTLDALVRAHEQYEDLAERGSKVVKDTRSPSTLVQGAEERTRELADKAGDLTKKAEKVVDEYKEKAEKVVDEYKDKAGDLTKKAEKVVDEYKEKAEKVVDEYKDKAGDLTKKAEKYTGDWGHKADDAAHKANERAHKVAEDARTRARDVLKTVRTEADHLKDVVTHPTQRGTSSAKTQVAKAPKPTPRRRRVPMATEESAARPVKRTASVTKGAAAPMAGPAKKPTTPRKRVTAKATAPATAVTPQVDVEVKAEATVD
ncbi:MAG: hypothetical protein IPI32_08955 [Austwickia sp.]|nr:hypothetical protein [Austwickia sp.]MBK8436375.1 hypothetical protein [Austwickia sp.]MBK9102051.1 hypothetical protein [Austwickia sp.]